MKNQKVIRPRLLKRWFSKSLMTLFTLYFITVIVFFLWGFGLDTWSEGAITRELVNDWLENIAGMCIVTGSIVLFLEAILFKGLIAEPVRYGSTRYEAQLGYELFCISSFVIITVSIVVSSLLCKVLSNVSIYTDNLLDVILFMFLSMSIIKFLYGIYMDNTFKIKILCSIVIGIIIIVCMVGYILTLAVYKIEALLLYNCLYIYPILIIVGIAFWWGSIRIISSKRDNISIDSMLKVD